MPVSLSRPGILGQYGPDWGSVRSSTPATSCSQPEANLISRLPGAPATLVPRDDREALPSAGPRLGACPDLLDRAGRGDLAGGELGGGEAAALAGRDRELERGHPDGAADSRARQEHRPRPGPVLPV